MYDLRKGKTQIIRSRVGNNLTVANKEITYVFKIGKAPLLKSFCKVNVTDSTEICNSDIETYVIEKFDSIVIDENDLEKYNSRQGRIGNCWFLQTVVSMYASYPEKIIAAFIKPELIETTGIVAMRLWSSENKCWRLVIMDDYLPWFYGDDWYCSSPSGKHKNRFWVALIEKAVAKQCGSFKRLNAYKCFFGLLCFDIKQFLLMKI